jgi:ABC-type dipeptide/oligopeptide/nickel transport system permease component/ABC-type transport system substrate-binding protein
MAGRSDSLGNPVTVTDDTAQDSINDFVEGLLGYQTPALNVLAMANDAPPSAAARARTATTRHAWNGLLPLLLLLTLLWPVLSLGRDWLQLGTQLEPPGLDPSQSAAAAIGEMTFPTVYEGLVRLTSGGGIEPALATAWQLSPDRLNLTFQLRRDVRFHDGTPFDAEAVRFSLERAVAPGSFNPQKAPLACIDHVIAEEKLRVTLALNHPCSGLLSVLGWPAAAMLSPSSAQDNARHPIGTGPFRFLRWQRGVGVSLERNDDYWGGPATLAGVTFRFLGDPNAALDALEAGDIDGYALFPAPETITRLRQDPRFQTRVAPGEGKGIMALNHRQPALADRRVRLALAMAIDRQAVIDTALFGQAQPIGSHYARIDPGYIDLTAQTPFDPAAARRLLAEAGYGQGLTLRLALPPLAYARRSGELITAELAEIGVRVVLQPLEWVAWLDRVYTRHDFDLTIVVHLEPMDYGIYGRDDYYFGYVSAPFKALLARLDDAALETERLALLGAVQRTLADDAVNVFLFNAPVLSVWDARLSDLWQQTPVQQFDLHHAHFSDGTAEARTAGRDGGGALAACALLLGLLLLALLAAVGPQFALRQLLGMAITLLLASALLFAVLALAPGDPARFMLGMNADPAALAALRTQLGLDRPLPARYLSWLTAALQGDFGSSVTYRLPVAGLIRDRLQLSLPLTLLALALSSMLALLLAVGMLLARRSWLGGALTAVASLLVAVPNFWLGLLLVTLFGVELRWFPAGGFAGWAQGPGPALGSLTLPALALALPQAAILARLLQGSLEEQRQQDYVRTARAKGRSERAALLLHALPNALPPLVSVLGMQFSVLLAGSVLVENVFFLPGIGRLVFEAIGQRDLVVVQAVALVLLAQVMLVALLADLAAAALDPRRRTGLA